MAWLEYSHDRELILFTMFQKVFGMAYVQGMPAQSGVAPQPIGYSSGLRGLFVLHIWIPYGKVYTPLKYPARQYRECYHL